MSHITLKSMLGAGVHFGHQTQRWNPKMKPYVYTARGGIHIIDLQKSLILAKRAAAFIKESASGGERLIFVGTKKQAIEPIHEAAVRSGQYWVTKRWLGGMLTNFTTIKASIDRLKKIDRMRDKGELSFFSKKERARMEKEYQKLDEYLSGIRNMKDNPSALFVVDLNKEHIAVAEAKKLGIKVVGIADTNSNPESVDYPIPGNDDATRSIRLFTEMIADAYLEGVKEWEAKKKVIDPEVTKEKTAGIKEGVTPEGGPSVIRVAKGRKLVAAGTAEDVEIEQELEMQQKEVGGVTEESLVETSEAALGSDAPVEGKQGIQPMEIKNGH